MVVDGVGVDGGILGWVGCVWNCEGCGVCIIRVCDIWGCGQISNEVCVNWAMGLGPGSMT